MHHLSACLSHRNARATWAHSCCISLPDASVLAQHSWVFNPLDEANTPQTIRVHILFVRHLCDQLQPPSWRDTCSTFLLSFLTSQAGRGWNLRAFQGIRLYLVPGRPMIAFSLLYPTLQTHGAPFNLTVQVSAWSSSPVRLWFVVWVHHGHQRQVQLSHFSDSLAAMSNSCPTLQTHAEFAPFNLNSSGVSVVFTCSSAALLSGFTTVVSDQYNCLTFSIPSQ